MEQILLGLIVNGRKAIGWSKDPDKFDAHAFKRSILEEAGINNFQKKVGRNPDIGFDRSKKIVLKGRGEFRGRTYMTEIDVDKYFSALVLLDGWKIVGNAVYPDHKQRARRAWPILTRAAKDHQTYTYKELCESMELHHRTATWFLGEIQEYCRTHNLPALQALVVNQVTRLPGAGYALPLTSQAYEAERNRVFNHSWQPQPPPDL